MNLPLVDSGDVSRSEVLRMQREASKLEGEIVNVAHRLSAGTAGRLCRDRAGTGDCRSSSSRSAAQCSRAPNCVRPTDGVIANIARDHHRRRARAG